jgi:hypothetical protein
VLVSPPPSGDIRKQKWGIGGYQQQNVEQKMNQEISQIFWFAKFILPGMMVLFGEDLAILMQADPHNQVCYIPFRGQHC